jgi:hypothetical protein
MGHMHAGEMDGDGCHTARERDSVKNPGVAYALHPRATSILPQRSGHQPCLPC